MKRIPIVFALCFGLVGAIAVAQTAFNFIGSNSVLQWDNVLTDVNGGPEVIAKCQVALTTVQANMNSGGVPLKLFDTGPVNEHALDVAVNGLVAGNYLLWVRVADTAGNWSHWSKPLEVALDNVAPGTPVNLHIKVNVTVEVNR